MATPAWRQTQVANREHHSSHGPYLVQLLPCSRYPSWLRAMRRTVARLTAAAAGAAAAVAVTVWPAGPGAVSVTAAAAGLPTRAIAVAAPASASNPRLMVWSSCIGAEWPG